MSEQLTTITYYVQIEEGYVWEQAWKLLKHNSRHMPAGYMTTRVKGQCYYCKAPETGYSRLCTRHWLLRHNGQLKAEIDSLTTAVAITSELLPTAIEELVKSEDNG